MDDRFWIESRNREWQERQSLVTYMMPGAWRLESLRSIPRRR